MNCPACHRPMTELFLSTACDHCDFGPKAKFVGYAMGQQHGYVLVFSTPAGARQRADKWGHTDVPIHEVYSLTKLSWEASTLYPGAVMSAESYEVMPDHRHPADAPRVWYGPEVPAETTSVERFDAPEFDVWSGMWP